MIAFFNTFFNYIVLLAIFVLATAIGVSLGRFARKKKDESISRKLSGSEK